MFNRILEWLRDSFPIILRDYAIFIITVPTAYACLGPAKGSFLSLAALILCSLISYCAWHSRRTNQEAHQQENIGSTNTVILEPFDLPSSDGLDPSFIVLLPTYTFKKGRDESLECSVCLGGLQEGETVKQLPICTHLFHEECIDKWLALHSTCPLCRVGMDTDQVAMEARLTVES